VNIKISSNQIKIIKPVVVNQMPLLFYADYYNAEAQLRLEKLKEGMSIYQKL
jgi:hypothetical protein